MYFNKVKLNRQQLENKILKSIYLITRILCFTVTDRHNCSFHKYCWETIMLHKTINKTVVTYKHKW